MALAKAGNSTDRRVEELLGQLTLREKVSLLSGKDAWRTMAVERLGIPSLTLTDGPHGVRACDAHLGRTIGKTTYFPTGVSMAASWNPAVIEQMAAALAEETLAMDCDVILAPCVNIVRGPLAGRNFEAFAEDPYLAGRIGVAYVKGVQKRGVGTSLKHYACNNQEGDRMRGNSVVDERTLREIYLPAFESIVKETQPWTVMCAYNRVNGVYASQNDHLLNRILRDEWGFEGVVISDWGANHTIFESVQGGLDIEMPGPARYFGRLLEEAVTNWQIEESVIDNAVHRILRLLLRSGRIANPKRPRGSVNTPAHQAISRKVAEEAITLLKNDGALLPLNPRQGSSIAVIGPNALLTPIGGGSSWVDTPYRTGPLDILKERLGAKVKITYSRGCENWSEIPRLKTGMLKPAKGKGHGLWTEYFSNTTCSGKPALSRLESAPDFWFSGVAPVDGIDADRYSIRWTGSLIAPATGLHALELTCTGGATISIDGKRVARRAMPSPARKEQVWGTLKAKVSLDKGKPCRITIEYSKCPGETLSRVLLGMGRISDNGFRDEIAAAAKSAAASDRAIIFAGFADGHETEGADRANMELTGPQAALISAVARSNPNTVVVVNAGSPVTMPWIDDVPAVLLAYYPGMEGGNAVVDALLGKINPSGKLPVTWPEELRDAPTALNFPGTREVRYGEGVFVGYRYYDKKAIVPLFPFGHGLSYTSFTYRALTVPRTVAALEDVRVSVTISNAGKRAGAEVVQLYVGDPVCSLQRPARELKRFAKVFLRPGQSKKVEFSLDRRAFAFYDPYHKAWVAEKGDFEISAGSSSADIRQRATLKYTE